MSELLRHLLAEELAVAYLSFVEGRLANVTLQSGEPNPVFEWEHLIIEHPERAWPVFVELLKQRGDDRALEQISYRVELLLQHHWDAFHERVGALAHKYPRLFRILPSNALNQERYETKGIGNEMVIEAYLKVIHHHDDTQRLKELIQNKPEQGLQVALELIKRGPSYGFESFDVFPPLLDALKFHGAKIIDNVEAAAASSFLVRKCLWRIKQQEWATLKQHQLPESVWQQLDYAIGQTTDYTDEELPSPNRHTLSLELERILDSWVEYEKAFWAHGHLEDLTRDEPEKAWTIILSLIARVPTEEDLGAIAAGPLEYLLRLHGLEFIERVEIKAAADVRVRVCLAGVWQTSMPDDLWQRVRNVAVT